MRPLLPFAAALLLLFAVLLSRFLFAFGHYHPERLLALPAGAGGGEQPPSEPLALADGSGDAERLSKELVAVGGGGGVDARQPKELLVKPPPRRDAASRAVLELDPGVGSGRSLHIHNNGTIELVDPKSLSTVWQLSTGSPLSSIDHVITSTGDLDYFLHKEGTGIVKHPLRIEDFIDRTQIQGSVVTTGSKTSTIYWVDADRGEIICKRSLPGTLGERGDRMREETQSADSCANIIMIVRTDYSLSSFDLGQCLWNRTVSSFIARFYTKCDHPSMLRESHYLQGNIPVGCTKNKADEQLQLPPANSTIDILLNNRNSGDDAEVPKQAQPSFEPALYRVTPVSTVLSNVGSDTDVEPGNVSTVFDRVTPANVGSNSNWKSTNLSIVLCLLVIVVVVIVYRVYRSNLASQPSTNDKILTDLRGRPDGTPKKRKVRRKDGTINSPNGFSVSEKKGGIDQARDTLFSEKYTLMESMKSLNGRDGRRVGKLFVSNVEIGKGSNGTVVFEGFYDGRPVAVKRLVLSHNDIALKEIQNLMASDQDPNIVRLYGVEEDNDFVYIALERCTCSLADLIQECSDSSSSYSTSDYQTVTNIQLNRLKVMVKDIELWRPDGLPSSQLLKLMRDVVAGVVHLHRLGIIHRDLKPQNVLITMEGSMEGSIRAKLSDMGISKRLQENMSSLSRHSTGSGSSGWQAPEQLIHGRQTRALDIFSLGSLLFYCITKGKHPFGDYFERDVNIINNRFDLFVVDYIPEAVHLFSQLLHPDPEMRPTAVYVFHHPLFWSSELRLSFLRDTSDRIDKANETELLNDLESIGPVAFGGKWREKLDAALLSDMGRYRKYNFESTRDLLRLIRNKSGHYRELPAELQESLGSLPEGFDLYFSSRFPKLLIEVYKVMWVHCKEEVAFSKYFKGSLV